MEAAVNITEDNTTWKGYADFIDRWFLMSTPYPILAIMSFYLVFVLKLGPDFMKNRAPFKLNNIVLLYNIFQVFCSAFILSFGSRILWNYGFLSSECMSSNYNLLLMVSTGTHYYVLAKVTELLDTVFFVLRKKYNQVTFLHVYHHSLMVIASWLALKYEPSYSCVFLGTINSFVHIVMYAYYGLATFPQIAPYLWWKKYITKLQLTQFFFIIIQVTAYNYNSGCPPSKILLATIFFNLVLMIYLFTDFYIKAYTKNKKDKADKLKRESIKTGKYLPKSKEFLNNNNNVLRRNFN